MAVVSYTAPLGTIKVGPRQMHAPKEASERGWWMAARKVLAGTVDLPSWSMIRDSVKISVDEAVITYHWDGGDLFISRKRNLR